MRITFTEQEIKEMARKLRNKRIKEWREKNKEKVKQQREKYWINKAIKELEKGNVEND